jgi:hypothetical protein
MINRFRFCAGLVVLLCVRSVSFAAEEKADTPASFSVASVHLEQNATDGDVEAVIEVIGGDDGLTKLTIVDPNGQSIVDVSAPVGATLGMRQFHFETPEPKDVDSLKKAFPEGAYAVTGTTADGKTLRDKRMLTHKLPAPTTILRPKADAKNVDPHHLEISWTAVKDAAGYTIELEGEGGADLTAKLPKSVTKFAVPDGFLQPGADCQVGIGTVSADGNVSVVEVEFKTAGKK